MSDERSMYQQLGIDPQKSSIREIYNAIIDNEYPGAWVNIVTDPELPLMAFTSHSDGDGSKSIQRNLHFRETGNKEIFRGATDDAFSMNWSDVGASGFASGFFIMTQTMNINPVNVPKDIITKENAFRVVELLDLHRRYGIKIKFLGGETADLPDQVKSSIFDINVTARTNKSNIISGNTEVGDKIWGFASDGRAAWENALNFGIMSNGYTLARCSIMHTDYNRKYPYLRRDEDFYNGRFKVGDRPGGLFGVEVSEALLSPSRHWIIVIKALIDILSIESNLHLLHGITVNTGGGATKIGHLGSSVTYVKQMPEPAPIFQFIKDESGESWENMFETFNCGVGVDIIGSDKGGYLQSALDRVSKLCKICLYELGECEKLKNKKKVILETPYGVFDDYGKEKK